MKKCPHCNGIFSDDFEKCPQCDIVLSNYTSDDKEKDDNEIEKEKMKINYYRCVGSCFYFRYRV